MIEQDTVKLLRECDAGVRMGIDSISDLLDRTHSKRLQERMEQCKREHEGLQEEIDGQLLRFEDDGKAPNPIAKSMSWMKTGAKMAVDASDRTVADLITDGCNMGVKSLNRYLNQYQAADERSKDIAKRLIRSEEQLAIDIRSFL